MFGWLFGTSGASATAAPAASTVVVEKEETTEVTKTAVEPTVVENASAKSTTQCCDADCACGGLVGSDGKSPVFMCRQCAAQFQNPTELVKHRLVCTENGAYGLAADDLDETRLQMQRLHSLGTGLTAAKKQETRASVMSLYGKRKPAISAIATESISTDVVHDKLSSMRNEPAAVDDEHLAWPLGTLPPLAATARKELAEEEIIVRHGVQKLAPAKKSDNALAKGDSDNDVDDFQEEPVDEREQERRDEAAFHEQKNE